MRSLTIKELCEAIDRLFENWRVTDHYFGQSENDNLDEAFLLLHICKD